MDNQFLFQMKAGEAIEAIALRVVENQSGNSHIGGILHMPALHAVLRNAPVYKKVFDRLTGKRKMLGYMAVQKNY